MTCSSTCYGLSRTTYCLHALAAANVETIETFCQSCPRNTISAFSRQGELIAVPFSEENSLGITLWRTRTVMESTACVRDMLLLI
ncbi:5877_t:CDS:2 [Ambispora gerdemannii]|uniref:5877_t:CDS:1 n=1 Tax=Ambispora gerdemannii TaxID=144530 RepID=A0A9N9F8R0_9GLOM|nr:5877_t:CDS:2 [Ambispora gerdemannii]